MKKAKKSFQRSSSEEDEAIKEELKQITMAVNPLLNHIRNPINNEDSSKSQKIIINNWDPGHSGQTLNLSQEAKSFLAEKLSDSLTQQIRYINKKSKNGEDDEDEMTSIQSGIYLFSSSKNKIISFKSSSNIIAEVKEIKTNEIYKKSRIKKRKIAEEVEESDDEDSKLKSVAVSVDWINSTINY